MNADDINNIEELMDALDIMDEYGLDTDGVNTITEAQSRLRKYLLKSYTQDKPEVTSIREVVEENQAIREKLLTLLKDVREFVQKIPPVEGVPVCHAWPNIINDIERHEEELLAESPAILVAGETGAGKSTLLNLLLGELANELLPVAHLSSTSVICELRYGEIKRMKAYPQNPDLSVIEEYLEEDVVEQLARYIHVKGEREQFAWLKVEIFWPCEWLKGGIVIVDSPGVGENDVLTDMVKEYIPQASGFIYVINTPNAGGIDPDRLQDLLLSHLAGDDVNNISFNPKSAMFICNKWDQVPLNEREKVKRTVSRKLQEVWSGFSHSQLFFLSAKQTHEELKENYVSDHYRAVMNGIKTLIPMGFKSKMIPHYLLGKRVIDRCLLEMRTYVRNKEGNNDILNESLNKLSTLKRKANTVVDELKNQLQIDIRKTIKDLSNHLCNSTTVSLLSYWLKNECPRSRSYSQLESLKIAYINKRIRNEISKWDSTEQRFECIQQRFIARCRAYFQSMDQELVQIEKDLSADPTEQKVSINKTSDCAKEEDYDDFIIGDVSISTNLTTAEKVVIGATAPVWVPLGMLVSLVALPSLGVHKLVQKYRQSRYMAKYEAEPEVEMEQLTKQTLEKLVKSKEVDDIIHKHFAKLEMMVDTLYSHILNIIAADEGLLNRLINQVNIENVLKEHYVKLCKEGASLSNQLGFLYVTRLGDYSTNMAAYTDWVSKGSGANAEVYRASVGNKFVALKIIKEALNERNVDRGFLREEENLRALQCENVIGFIEAVIYRSEDQLFPVFVMEYCETSLDEIIYSSHYTAPSVTESCVAATIIAARYAYGISNGLAYIHNKGFLHRDLKPQNILVSENGQNVKIADLGLAKLSSQITGTVAGTPLYMAPEVWSEKKYSEMADMYSFGMVMWELWYGCCVIVNFRGKETSAFLADLYLPGQIKPEGVWRRIVEACLMDDPASRLPAAECRTKLLQNYKL